MYHHLGDDFMPTGEELEQILNKNLGMETEERKEEKDENISGFSESRK
jgi:hypothetical protein